MGSGRKGRKPCRHRKDSVITQVSNAFLLIWNILFLAFRDSSVRFIAHSQPRYSLLLCQLRKTHTDYILVTKVDQLEYAVTLSFVDAVCTRC